jgi:hypothetical protein
MLTGGIVGVQPYVNPGPGEQPRYDAVRVALKTEEMGVLVAEYGQMVDPTKVYSLGRFQAENPGPDGFCPVVNEADRGAKLPAAEVALQAVGPRPDPEDPMMMLPALPAVTLRNEWSDVRFYVDPAFPGTQFTGTLTYTKNNCTAVYQAQGLYPAAACGRANPVDGGPRMLPDPEACSPCADPSKGRRFGSGISPDVEVACNESTLTCLPTKQPPSRQATSIVCPVPPRPDAFPPYDTTPAPRPPDAGTGADAPADAPVPMDMNGAEAAAG